MQLHIIIAPSSSKSSNTAPNYLISVCKAPNHQPQEFGGGCPIELKIIISPSSFKTKILRRTIRTSPERRYFSRNNTLEEVRSDFKLLSRNPPTKAQTPPRTIRPAHASRDFSSFQDFGGKWSMESKLLLPHPHRKTQVLFTAAFQQPKIVHVQKIGAGHVFTGTI